MDDLMFAAFRIVCMLSGLALVVFGLAWSVSLALNQVLSTATLIEAAIEAKKQGRAPILRAWLRRTDS
jgi:hypothetical protein